MPARLKIETPSWATQGVAASASPTPPYLHFPPLEHPRVFFLSFGNTRGLFAVSCGQDFPTHHREDWSLGVTTDKASGLPCCKAPIFCRAVYWLHHCSPCRCQHLPSFSCCMIAANFGGFDCRVLDGFKDLRLLLSQLQSNLFFNIAPGLRYAPSYYPWTDSPACAASSWDSSLECCQLLRALSTPWGPEHPLMVLSIFQDPQASAQDPEHHPRALSIPPEFQELPHGPEHPPHGGPRGCSAQGSALSRKSPTGWSHFQVSSSSLGCLHGEGNACPGL